MESTAGPCGRRLERAELLATTGAATVTRKFPAVRHYETNRPNHNPGIRAEVEKVANVSFILPAQTYSYRGG